MMKNGKIVSVREQIAEQIRSDIIAGTLEPNTKLNEQSLADRFGVSRGPIRDVLIQLTKEGLLVSKNNCGVSVNSLLDSGMQSLMVDLRRKIETHSVSALVDKLTDEDFDQLDGILQSLEDAFLEEDFTLVTKADLAFHQYLIERAGGTELLNLWLPIVMRMRMNYKRVTTAKECVNEHRTIVTALKNREKRKAVAALKANIK